ncbi:MAG: hypothetical protein AAF411_24390 [Myxococcota bacterium]
MAWRWCAWVMAAMAVGCSSGSSVSIDVRVQTDFLAGTDFTSIRIELTGAENDFVEVPTAGGRFALGERVHTFDVRSGNYEVNAELLDPDGRRVGQRIATLNAVDDSTVTLVITRSCENVSCPNGGDPRLTECSGGRCVSPDCTPETPQFCLEGCVVDSDCPALSGCAEGVCLADGSCIAVPDDDLCAGGERCDPTSGCTMSGDAGGPDMGGIDMAPIDMGPAECGAPCREIEGRPCAVGVVDCSTGDPVCMETGPGNAGRICRPAVDVCDAEEVCNGVSADCPEVDEKRGTDFVCRSAAGECDVEEVCSGTGDECPLDAFQPVGTRCVDGGFCDATGMCSDTCEPDASCQPEDQPCRTGTVDCSSGVPTCIADGNQPDGTTCGTTTLDPFGSCGSFGSTCSETGTRSRTVTEFRCAAGSCETQPRTETENCSRDTDGTSCGSAIVGDFSACGGFSGACGESGMRTRSITTPVCAASECQNNVTMETASCSRDTDGVNCGAPSPGPYGACGGFTGTCGNSGTQSRTVTTPTCGSGSCGSASTTETRACTRNTNGTSCGSVSFGPYSACGGFTSTCDQTGTQSRDRRAPTCNAGGCATVTTSESRSCTRNTNGVSCGTGRACSGGSCNPCPSTSPTVSGTAGIAGMTFFNSVSASGTTITFGSTNGTSTSVTLGGGVTASGSYAPGTGYLTAVSGSGNRLTFTDNAGGSGFLTFSGATLSGGGTSPVIFFGGGSIPGLIQLAVGSSNRVAFSDSLGAQFATVTLTGVTNCP